MELESRRLRLEEVTWEDLENIHQLYLLPEVDEYNTLGIPQNIEQTRRIVNGMIITIMPL